MAKKSRKIGRKGGGLKLKSDMAMDKKGMKKGRGKKI